MRNAGCRCQAEQILGSDKVMRDTIDMSTQLKLIGVEVVLAIRL
jgi:hypothetical protein